MWGVTIMGQCESQHLVALVLFIVAWVQFPQGSAMKDIHGGVEMGVSSHSCDDAKVSHLWIHVTSDTARVWDHMGLILLPSSSVNYRLNSQISETLSIFQGFTNKSLLKHFSHTYKLRILISPITGCLITSLLKIPETLSVFKRFTNNSLLKHFSHTYKSWTLISPVTNGLITRLEAYLRSPKHCQYLKDILIILSLNTSVIRINRGLWLVQLRMVWSSV